MKQLIRQSLYELRSQPVIAWVTLTATALSIFLVMAVMMMASAPFAEYAPVSDRGRMLYGKFLHIKDNSTDGDSSSAMSPRVALMLYKDLESAEATALISDTWTAELFTSGKSPRGGSCVNADADIWRVFDYVFLAGKPYTADQAESDASVIVISRAVAEEFFAGAGNAVGQTLYVASMPYKVTGVVENVSPLADEAYSEVWIPLKGPQSGWQERYGWDPMFGSFSVVILAHSSDDFPAIRREVEQRKAVLRSQLAAEERSLVDHGSPFTRMEAHYVQGSNGDSECDNQTRIQWILYLILLLIPAINLSSMTQSRLRRRMAEVGVRRAFGASRSDIIMSIISENLVVTLIGGLAGLVMCFLFAIFFSDMIFQVNSWRVNVSAMGTVPAGVLFNWSVFGFALGTCFILNLLSSGIPAWRASRTDPVAAINDRLS